MTPFAADDPRTQIDAKPMLRAQWTIVAMMIGLNALDGFDVLSISFAAPGIAAAWGIDRAALGIVLSLELVGMSLGSVLLGRLADRIGRRTTILWCLVVMTAGMAGAAAAGGILSLAGCRLLTGFGIGGMLAATNAAVAEAANARRRSLCVVLMAAGYPVGSVVGGIVAARLLMSYDWRAIFVFGALATAAFIPLVLAAVPESLPFLIQRGGRDALPRVNRLLARLGHDAIAHLPAATTERGGTPTAAALLRGAHRGALATLTIAYLAHIMTFYFILKWIPKIVADLGFAPSTAAGVLVWASLGGATGSVLLGLLTGRARLLHLTVAAMIASTAMVVLFGFTGQRLAQLSIAAAAAGLCTNAGVVGLYALIAQTFPTELRASATGIVIGIGRGGSAMAPALAGWLFAAGIGLPGVATAMALGSTVAALLLMAQRRRIVA
ncbi:MFS transporter [Sphingomonas adhaesiva]|uniref:MFS transporter n=1 Tax=Sphingomonas adhaesiva TaxID=28212 RepID=UPI002FFBC300